MKLCAYRLSEERRMDQIRNTMMQHEALFKEQVEALHRLYGIQRSAMQTIRERVRVVLDENKLQCRALESKSSRQVYASSSEDSKAFESHCTFVRDFDLEKIPEDCMDGNSNSNTNKKTLSSNQGSSEFTTRFDHVNESEDNAGRFSPSKRLFSVNSISSETNSFTDPHCTKDGSTICDSEMKVTESESCANSENPLEDESIAAEILLSFGSKRSRIDQQSDRAEIETNRVESECTSEEIYGRMDENVKWIKSISRRRTLRRGR